MAERMPCEFFLIRYVPDVVKGEFVNIGVVLRAAGMPADAAGAVRFTRDWARVRCLDADADLALLESLESEIAARLLDGVSARDPKGVLETLEDSLSNCVQMTEPRATLAESLAAEMEQLMRLYVEPIRLPRTRAKSGRTSLVGQMRSEFERAGVWALMRKRINASAYTQAGDPLRIDCGYRPNGASPGNQIRMFQAVAVDTDAEGAKGLAYSASRLREGVRRVEGAALELTAVVEARRAVAGENEDEAAERYAFAVSAMEREAIRVVTVADLARVAETAKRELGL